MAKMIVSEESRKGFFNLRRTFEKLTTPFRPSLAWNLSLSTERSTGSELAPSYRKGVGPKLVDMYKDAYESIEILKYVDTVTPQYKPKFDALEKGTSSPVTSSTCASSLRINS